MQERTIRERESNYSLLRKFSRKNQFFSALIAIVSLIVANGISVDAISAEQFKITVGKQIPYYDVCSVGGSAGDGSASAIVNGSSENAEAIFKFLISTNFKKLGDKPMNAAQAAGFLGNMQLESGFDPNAINSSSGAFGIAQWTEGRKTALQELAASQGKEANDLSVQLDHLKNELDGGEYVLDDAQFRSTTDPKVAAEIIDRKFERSEGTHVPQRQNYAQQYYGKFKDLAPSSGGSSFELTGDKVTVIGDSISEGAKSEFEKQLSGVDVHAKVSKHFATDAADAQGGPGGLKILTQLKTASELREIVVFALGTNDANLSKEKIEEAVDLVGKKTHIVFVTNYDKDNPDKYKSNNNLFREVESEKENVIVADWEGFAKTDPAKYMSDNVHPNNEGQAAFVETIIDAIKAKMPSGDEQGCEKAYEMADGVNYCQIPINPGMSEEAKSKLAYDPAWENSCKIYNLHDYGCGLVSTASAASALSGKKVTPDMVVESNGGACWVGGVSPTPGNAPVNLVNDRPELGLKAEPYYQYSQNGTQMPVSEINKIIEDGGILWFCANSNLKYANGFPWTTKAHCGAIKGIAPSGNYKVFDSAGPCSDESVTDGEIDPQLMSEYIGSAATPTAIYKK